MCRKISLDVAMFGQFSISHTADGKTLTITDQASASRRLWGFFAYLISYRNTPITQDQLIDILWNGEETEDPVNTMKTLLHRARRLLETLGIEDAKQVLLYRKGTYAWGEQVEFSVDTERFDSQYELAMERDTEKLSPLLAAIHLYSGPLLPKSNHETWAISMRMYYQARFMKMCVEAALLLEQEGRYVDMIEICQRAIHVDPYDEPTHLLLMQALAANGSQQAAISHYAYVTKLFMDQLGVAPSEQLTSLYRKLVKATNCVEMDLREVRKSLVEEFPASAPYYCEFAIFQDIYRLESRTAERTGQVIQLSMITVQPAQGKSLTPKQASLAMERLQQVITTTLRRGDAFTQYSASQYLLLLPCATYENGNKVLHRIINNFKRLFPTMGIRLQFSVLPLLSNTMDQPICSV